MINANLEQFLDTGWFSEATLFYKGYIYWCEGGLDPKLNKMYISVYRFPAEIVDNKYFKRLTPNEPFEYIYEDWGNSEDEVKERLKKQIKKQIFRRIK